MTETTEDRPPREPHNHADLAVCKLIVAGMTLDQARTTVAKLSGGQVLSLASLYRFDHCCMDFKAIGDVVAMSRANAYTSVRLARDLVRRLTDPTLADKVDSLPNSKLRNALKAWSLVTKAQVLKAHSERRLPALANIGKKGVADIEVWLGIGKGTP